MTSKDSLCLLRCPPIGRAAEDLLSKVGLFFPSSLALSLVSRASISCLCGRRAGSKRIGKGYQPASKIPMQGEVSSRSALPDASMSCHRVCTGDGTHFKEEL